MATRSRSEAEQGLGYLFDHFREAIDVANRHFWTTYETDAHRITGLSSGSSSLFHRR